VRGVVDGAFVYDLYFQALSDAADDDAVFSDQDLPVVVPRRASMCSVGHGSSGQKKERVASCW